MKRLGDRREHQPNSAKTPTAARVFANKLLTYPLRGFIPNRVALEGVQREKPAGKLV
jgi:hypothetical protein